MTDSEGSVGPVIEYEVSATPVTLDDLEPTGEPQEPGELEEAMAWLREALKGGPMGAKEVVKEAGEVGIAKSTLKKAKRELGVVSAKGKKRTDTWEWSLAE